MYLSTGYRVTEGDRRSRASFDILNQHDNSDLKIRHASRFERLIY